jgi:hypothetical protein
VVIHVVPYPLVTSGAVETLILWENLPVMRYELKNPSEDEIVVQHLRPDQEKDDKFFKDAEVCSVTSAPSFPLADD